MPCRDYYDDHPDAYYTDVTKPALMKQISFAESALCAALDALQKSASKEYPPYVGHWIDQIDFPSAGIDRKELLDWRVKHKAMDEKHREDEKKRLRESAMAKLSKEEKEILGLK